MVTAEQLAIKALAREFAEGEIRPHVRDWDERRSLDDEIFRKLSELGFMGMRVPEVHSGLGLDTSTYLTALEELAWGDASVALAVSIQNGPSTDLLMKHASEELRREILPRMACGELLVAFALSEPEAGSDAGGLQTTAVKVGDAWRINGRKRWVTNGGRAGATLVFARTVPGSRGGRGIGAFLVDTSAAGYEVGAAEKTLGMRASETVGITLEDVQVPAGRLIGDPALGFRYAMQAVEVGRLGIAAQAVGIAQAAFEHAMAYAVEREQFGRALADFGAIQEKLAVMATRVAGARALTREAGERLQQGEADQEGGGENTSVRAGTAAAMAKLAASETATWVAREAVQIYGGYGYMRDYPVEKLMRDAKGTEIYEAPSEILRMIIAKDYVSSFRPDAG